MGASVTLLGEPDLASGDLRRYHAIVIGTRAYAVREDLKTCNRRLLDYLQPGGNLIVLYNTQEVVPDSAAPFPAQLPARAEEVSDEDAPVEILAPAQRAYFAYAFHRQLPYGVPGVYRLLANLLSLGK